MDYGNTISPTVKPTPKVTTSTIKEMDNGNTTTPTVNSNTKVTASKVTEMDYGLRIGMRINIISTSTYNPLFKRKYIFFLAYWGKDVIFRYK
tara:strand:- start:80 stop:355 length:276 start_codon:yes stop_codon:yes gene_type:complete